MTAEPIVVEGDVVVRVTKKVRTHYEGEPVNRLAVLDGRLVTEVDVLWAHEDGKWRPVDVRVTSSVARQDGRPSALSKTHVLSVWERRRFLSQFIDVAEPPAERVTITITEGTAG